MKTKKKVEAKEQPTYNHRKGYHKKGHLCPQVREQRLQRTHSNLNLTSQHPTFQISRNRVTDCVRPTQLLHVLVSIMFKHSHEPTAVWLCSPLSRLKWVQFLLPMRSTHATQNDARTCNHWPHHHPSLHERHIICPKVRWAHSNSDLGHVHVGAVFHTVVSALLRAQ